MLLLNSAPIICTEKTTFPFPSTLNGIWSWWRFSFHIEWDIILVTVFLSILNQMELHLIQNRKENRHHDHIPLNVEGNGNVVFSVQHQTGKTTAISCPRDWRLAASLGPNWVPLCSPLDRHSTLSYWGAWGGP